MNRRHRSAIWRFISLPALLWAGLATPAQAQIVRAYTPRYRVETFGRQVMFGNSITTCSTTLGSRRNLCANARAGLTSTSSDAVNNVFFMDYIDIDGVVDLDGNGTDDTFNSSSSDYNFPIGSSVRWAGLYWSGDTSAGSRSRLTPAGTPAVDTSKKGEMLLKGPGDTTYRTVVADNNDISGTRYSAFANVTALVRSGGSGTYVGANVQTGRGRDRYGGWTLIVVYDDPTEVLRSITIFDGFARVSSSNPIEATVSGFLTPPSGQFESAMGAIVYEGDVGFRPDQFFLDGDGPSDSDGDGFNQPFVPLGDSLNPTDNFFNSSNTILGTAITSRNPNYPNLLAMDMDIVDAVDGSGNNILPNATTEAGLRFTSAGDVYYPTAFIFSAEVFQPILTDSFQKRVIDVNGGEALPGDTLEYEITYTNTGNDAAVDVVVTDTIPDGTTYVPGSIVIASDPDISNIGSKSDGASDDEAEFDGSAITIRTGIGADATNGGRVDIGESVVIRFQVRVNPDLTPPTSPANQAGVSYVGITTGTSFTGVSDNPDTEEIDDPTVTPIAFPLGLAKAVVETKGRKVTLDFSIHNTSLETVTNLSLTDDLDSTFGVGNYSITSAPAILPTDNPGTITPNVNFTGGAGDTGGVANNTLLDPTNSSLLPGATTTVRVQVSVNNHLVGGDGNGNYLNSAVVRAELPTGGILTDISTNGTQPDVDPVASDGSTADGGTGTNDGDGDPSNNTSPTPIKIEPADPNLLLVKRITAVNGQLFTTYADDIGDLYDDNTLTSPVPSPPDTDAWPTDAVGDPKLAGATNGGNVIPSDEIEYTIYFLSSGDVEVEDAVFCDYIPSFTSILMNGFAGRTPQASDGITGAPLTIELFYNNLVEYHTGAHDGDRAYYFGPGIDPAGSFPGIDCDGDPSTANTNPNGAVVVNLGDLPDAATDIDQAYGYVRFRTRVK